MRKTGEMGDREKYLFVISEDYRSRRPTRLLFVDQLRETMSEAEIESSASTLAILKTRSLLRSHKPYEACANLIRALRENPLDLNLQIELSDYLEFVRDEFIDLCRTDPGNPLIEIYYKFLAQEGFLTIECHLYFSIFLVKQGRIVDAIPILLPLVELFPGLLGLRDAVEQVAMKVPNPKLHAFLIAEPSRMDWPTIQGHYEPRQVKQLRESLLQLQEELKSNPESLLIPKELKAILGEISTERPIDIALKDFYHLQARYDRRNGEKFAAVILLKALTEIDPANLEYRNSLKKAMDSLFKECVENHRNKKLKVDPREILEVVRWFGEISFDFFKVCALWDVADNQVERAKGVMMAVLSLNDSDASNLMAAFDIADRSGDEVWKKSLIDQIDSTIQRRPYDLPLVCFYEDIVKIQRAG